MRLTVQSLALVLRGNQLFGNFNTQFLQAADSTGMEVDVGIEGILSSAILQALMDDGQIIGALKEHLGDQIDLILGNITAGDQHVPLGNTGNILSSALVEAAGHSIGHIEVIGGGQIVLLILVEGDEGQILGALQLADGSEGRIAEQDGGIDNAVAQSGSGSAVAIVVDLLGSDA